MPSRTEGATISDGGGYGGGGSQAHARTEYRARMARVCDVPANAAPAQSGAAIRHKNRVKKRGGRSGRGGTLGRTGTCVRVRVDSLHNAPGVKKF